MEFARSGEIMTKFLSSLLAFLCLCLVESNYADPMPVLGGETGLLFSFCQRIRVT